jgi:hypothetical protein
MGVGWLGQRCHVPPPGLEDAKETIMKMTQLLMNARMSKVNQARQQASPRGSDRTILLSPEWTQRSRIQWPTQQQILQVSKSLARVTREGIRRESRGDYFNSGDFAYRLQEILRATEELLKKSQSL